MLRNRYQDQTRRRAPAPQDSQVRQLNRPAEAGLTALQRPCNSTPHGVPRADEPFRLGTDEQNYSIVETYERHKTSAIVWPCQTTSAYGRPSRLLSDGPRLFRCAGSSFRPHGASAGASPAVRADRLSSRRSFAARRGCAPSSLPSAGNLPLPPHGTPSSPRFA